MSSNTDILETINYILENIDFTRNVVESAYSVRKSLVDLTLNDQITELEFYKVSSVLTPQSRSPMWEKYFKEKHGFRSVHKDENKGDFERNGIYYEYKASGYNRDKSVNIVQIRLWQNCDYIVQSLSDEEVITFVLTHDEMEKETKLLNASIAHGTKTVSSASEHIELRMTLYRDTKDWKRWVENYKKTYP